RDAAKIFGTLLRRQPIEPKNLRAQANLLWNLREFEEATFVYRLAACRADKVEYHWDSFFIASRHVGGTDESIALLRSRFVRWGAISSQPSRTLFNSLNALDRTEEGLQVLAEALRLRPDDGELLLFAVEANARIGRHAEAGRLLDLARTREGRARWLRTAAQIADYRCDHVQALGHWRELATLNPADTTAHSAIARLLAVIEGEPAAVAHLQAACASLPHFLPLHQTLVQRLRDAPAEQALPALDQMLQLDPADAWALREKAIVLRRLGQLEAALACADEAVRMAPHAPASFGVRGAVLTELSRKADAHADYSQGIRLSIDADDLFDSLIGVCPDFSSRRAAVKFIHQELLKQNSLENAVLQFRLSARAIVSTDELEAMLGEYHEANPQVWSSWCALGTHYLETGAIDRALEIARGATERFPLVPRVWADLAKVHAKRADTPAEIESIQKTLAISPNWTHASRLLSVAYERQMQLEEAEHALRRAVAANPLEAINHGWLADILWRRRRPAEAIAAIETALTLNTDYDWAWDRLQAWSTQEGNPDRGRALAKQFTESRAGDAKSWLRLVRMRFGDPDVDANLAALDRAAQLTPRNTEVWDLRASLLAEHRRYDEALAACRPETYHGNIPYVLEGRAAWIEAQRGRIDAAIDQLKMVVTAHPDYRWGWCRLTEWYWEKKQFDDVRAAAEKWAWLEPESAIPHGYLASVHQQAKRRNEAKASYAQSIRADPLYSYGAAELLKMHLEDSEFDAARQVLKHYATHYAPWESLRAEIRLHVAAKDRIAAIAALQQLGRSPAAAVDSLARAVTEVVEAGWHRTVEEAMEPLVTDPAALPVAGEHWMKARRNRSCVWATFWRLLRIKTTPPHRHALLGAYVSWLGEGALRWRLRLACLEWGQTLRRDRE
ncbi:MAG TPA: tetratricopeptide repeat protein, partial [Candidatus Didemnitutus sp.]|nr:tetratricopeptide repeat protein [Candidatus Didemnitutus sp.]